MIDLNEEEKAIIKKHKDRMTIDRMQNRLVILRMVGNLSGIHAHVKV